MSSSKAKAKPRVSVPKLPRSVKTAYDLLTFIKKIILAEPKRMRMSSWLTPVESITLVPSRSPRGVLTDVGDKAARVRLRVFRTEGLYGSTPTLYLGADAARLFLDGVLTEASNQGTRAHARDVARHITAFQRDHAVQLKAQPLPGRTV